MDRCLAALLWPDFGLFLGILGLKVHKKYMEVLQDLELLFSETGGVLQGLELSE